MCDSFVYVSQSEPDTEDFGRRLAKVLIPGTTVALNGELGAGKTHLVRAVCRALGIDVTQVNSPTFVLMQSYTDGRCPVVHFDTYRLADLDEFLAIGGEDYVLDPGLICFVEWADRVASVLPADHLRVEISQTGECQRTFTIRANGEKSATLVARMNDEGGSPLE